MTADQNGLPLVAVVTPVYNGSPFIEKTLACVQAQTYPNIVHVVLDNASVDDTPHLIAEAKKNATVPIVTRRNSHVLSQTDNWNAAIGLVPREARYVKLLCADDLVRADAVEKLVRVAETHPSVNLVAAIDVFDDLVKPGYFCAGETVQSGRQFVRRLFWGDISWFPFPHLFYRASAKTLVNPFDAGTVPAQDADFVLRILLEGDLGVVNEPLFYTRKHETAATSLMGGDRLFIVPNVARLRRYGGEVLSPEELSILSKNSLRFALRHILAWKISGQAGIAGQMLQALSACGLVPTTMDYLAAVATWPVHKVRKTVREMRQPTPVRMTEADFLTQAG
jgi:glycosyltransferase involved in cell wall biosynthesis